LYILIDEYDNAVNKALGDAKNALYQYLYVDPNEELIKKQKQDIATTNSIFRRFFSEIKDQVANNAVGRVFITGVAPIALNDFTSGFNIGEQITHDERFAELCGLTRDDIRSGLSWLSEQEIEQHLNTMTEYYDGLMFHPDQKNRLFNTTLAIYYMKYLAQHGKAPSGQKLIDSNIQPSESVFNILSNTPLCLQIITKLFSSNNNEIYSTEEIIDIVSTRKMMDLVTKDEMFTLSLMYYLGALTQDKLPEEKNSGTVFKIPNKVIRREYIHALKERLDMQNSNAENLQLAITQLLRNKDIGPMCAFAEEKFKTLKGNAVKFQNEKDLQALFIYGIELYGKRVTGEAEFQFKDYEGKRRYADFLYQEDDAVHIEFKNLKTSHLIVRDERFDEYNDEWEKGYRINDKIEAMNHNELMKLQVYEPSYQYNRFSSSDKGNYVKRNLKTVGDVFENLLEQTRMNKIGIESKLEKKISSFAVLRVGLRKIIYQKVD